MSTRATSRRNGWSAGARTLRCSNANSRGRNNEEREEQKATRRCHWTRASLAARPCHRAHPRGRPDANPYRPSFRRSCCRPRWANAGPSAWKKSRTTTSADPAGTGIIFSCGEHTGTHFDAPIHWISGRDLPNNSVDTMPVEHFIAPAFVIDCCARPRRDADFLLTVSHLKAFEKRHGRIAAGVRGC